MSDSLYWGDLHCHTGLSYGAGTPEAALRNARAHVDFAAIIGHAFYPDMLVDAADETGWMGRHFGGFEKLKRLWPGARALIEREDRPGEFVTFLGYEWHSDASGDYNVLYRDAGPAAELVGADDVAGLKAGARGRKAYVFPHHIGYLKGERGLDWAAFTEDLAPVIEVCSGHGEFEADDGGPDAVDWVPMGPRVTRGCAREGLRRGFRFGFIGSTDNHRAYPAAYDGGRAGIYASALTREAIWEALARRRTIAAKGDSIAVWLEANGAPLGSEVRCPEGKVRLKCTVRAEDAIDTVELIRNEQVWRVWHPNEPGAAEAQAPDERRSDLYKIRLQFGWGNSPYLTEWAGRLEVQGGEVRAVRPYFQPARDQNPNEGGRQTLDAWDAGGFQFRCLALGPPQQYVMELAGRPDTRLVLEGRPVGLESTLGDLCQRSIGARERKHTATAVKVCRAVPERAYTFACDLADDLAALSEARYYVRLTQRNLQRAWTSPIWVTR